MRAIWSYGVALLIIIVIAVWMGTGTIVDGGHGPGKGEAPAISLVEPNGGPLTEAVKGVAPDISKDEAEAETAAKTIVERNKDEGGGENAAPRSVRIEVSTAKLMPIEVPLRGRTEAKNTVAATAETSGAVASVEVEKGQTVAAGDLLCTLDPSTRKDAVNQAQAALAQAEANLTQVQSSYESNMALVEKGLAPANTSDQLKTALAAAKAGVQSAETAIANASAELDRTQIRAKIGGIVQAPIASKGALLAAGQPCANVVQLDPMLFTAALPEAKMAYAKLGLAATVTTITGAKSEGKVTYIGSTADEATRSFPVEIELSNADGRILSGITADAVVNVGSAPVHILPQSVLTLDDNGVLGIRTVENGDTVAFHEVNIIKDTRDGVWLVGLPLKIDVITVGQEYVKSGQIVEARTVDGESAS